MLGTMSQCYRSPVRVVFVGRFFAVGIGSLHPDAEAESYRHQHLVSLDDADVVVFGLPRPPAARETHMGKPCLSDDSSSWYTELLSRWRGELSSAVAAGKTVFVVLTAPEGVFVATGEVEHSGTGRNARTTRIVTEQSNMAALPYELKGGVVGIGSEIREAPRSQVLRPYWTRFAQLSLYELRFAPQGGLTPLLTTKNPEQIVSAFARFKGGGHLVLLPAVHLREADDDKCDDEESGESGNGDGIADDSAFRLDSVDLVRRLLEVDALLSGPSSSPPPDWVQVTRYQAPAQRRLQQDLARAQEAEARARQEREVMEASLDDASLLQCLLFSQGTPLEDAVIRGLELMGVKAARVVVGDSEFDSVFTIDGLRMLGEVEGRDSAAIAIDKITQLERNVAEDFAREGIAEHAHGVLFGNPQRLVAPDKRIKTFTEKCMSSARRNGFALVLTHTMFEPAAYLEESGDLEYAAACRAAITAAKGQVVEFPDVPDTRSSEVAGMPATSK